MYITHKLSKPLSSAMFTGISVLPGTYDSVIQGYRTLWAYTSTDGFRRTTRRIQIDLTIDGRIQRSYYSGEVKGSVINLGYAGWISQTRLLLQIVSIYDWEEIITVHIIDC